MIKTFYCDAGTKNNGQFGKQKTVIVVVDEWGKVLIEKQVGDKTNNEGELLAIIEASTLVPRGSHVYSDSLLAVNWTYGTFTTKIDRLRLLIDDALQIVKRKKIELEWIRREENLAGHYIEMKYTL